MTNSKSRETVLRVKECTVSGLKHEFSRWGPVSRGPSLAILATSGFVKEYEFGCKPKGLYDNTRF